MNYLHIIPTDIYIQIYKCIYDDCMKEVVSNFTVKRNTNYKDKLIRRIMNDDIWIYYTSLDMFNAVSLGIIGNACNMMGDIRETELIDEELYYLSKITEYNFRQYHYMILITELPENFKEASCIRMKLSYVDTPLYYLLKDFLTTWIELIYYTNKLVKEYVLINNLEMELDFFPLLRFEVVLENGYTVIVPCFEELY